MIKFIKVTPQNRNYKVAFVNVENIDYVRETNRQETEITLNGSERRVLEVLESADTVMKMIGGGD